MNESSLARCSVYQKLKKYFLVALIASLVLSAILAIWMFVFQSLDIKIILTTISVGGYSLLGLCCAALLDRNRYQKFALVGIAFALISFLMVMFLVWVNPVSNIFDDATGVLSIISFAMAHSALLIILVLSSKSSNKIVSIGEQSLLIRISLILTFCFIAIVAAMLIYLVLFDIREIKDIFYRLLFSMAVLDILGTIVTPILKKICR